MAIIFLGIAFQCCMGNPGTFILIALSYSSSHYRLSTVSKHLMYFIKNFHSLPCLTVRWVIELGLDQDVLCCFKPGRLPYTVTKT